MNRDRYMIRRRLTVLGLALAALLLVAAEAAPPSGNVADQLTTNSPAREEGKTGSRPAEPPPINLSKQDIDNVVAILREQNPPLAQKLVDALKNHPERAEKLLAQSWPRLRKLAEMRQQDPKGFDLMLQEGRINRLIEEKLRLIFRSPNPVAADQTELRKLLSQEIDLRIKMRRHEIELIEKRIADIDASRERTINDRVMELLARKQGSGPRPPGPGGPMRPPGSPPAPGTPGSPASSAGPRSPGGPLPPTTAPAGR